MKLAIKTLMIVTLCLSMLTLKSTSSGKTGNICEGNACSVIKLRWDDSQKKHMFKNEGSRNVKVHILGVLSGTSQDLTLLPNEEKATFFGSYRNPFYANYVK